MHDPQAPVAPRSSGNRPPGQLAIVNAVAATMAVVAIWRGSERTGDLGSIGIVGFLWLIVLAAWLVWFLLALGSNQLSSRRIVGWAVVPLLFALTAVSVFGNHALGLRFAMSETRLDQAADAALGGSRLAPGWIGLYPVEGVSVDGHSVRFEIAGQLPLVRDPSGPIDSVVSYEPLNARWSIEYEFFAD